MQGEAINEKNVESSDKNAAKKVLRSALQPITDDKMEDICTAAYY